MTDEAKALVYRMRNLQVLEYPQDRIRCADLIETQAREIERLRGALVMCVAEMMRASGRLEIIATCNEDRRIVAALSGTCDYARSALAGDSHDQ